MLLSSILLALYRERPAILAVALAYALSLGVGIAMVHTGNPFALAYRDQLVAGAIESNPAALALENGDRWRAAVIDFGENLLLGALPKTVAGLGIVFPFPLVAFQGWVGGIVSVDNAHVSRLANAREAIYYIGVVILQLIPYTLAVAAGVNLGIAFLRPTPYYQGAKWFGLPQEAVRDVGRIYLLVVPLFLFASLVEFLFA